MWSPYETRSLNENPLPLTSNGCTVNDEMGTLTHMTESATGHNQHTCTQPAKMIIVYRCWRSKAGLKTYIVFL